MVMTAAQRREYNKKREKMLKVLRERGGTDSAFDEELPESVQAAMRERREKAAVAEEKRSV